MDKQELIKELKNAEAEVQAKYLSLRDLKEKIGKMNFQEEKERILGLLHLDKDKYIEKTPPQEAQLSKNSIKKGKLTRRDVLALMKKLDIDDPNPRKKSVDLQSRGLLIDGHKTTISEFEDNPDLIRKLPPELAKQVKHLLSIDNYKKDEDFPTTKIRTKNPQGEPLDIEIEGEDQDLNIDYNNISWFDSDDEDNKHLALDLSGGDDIFIPFFYKDELLSLADKHMPKLQRMYNAKKKEWDRLRAPFSRLIIVNDVI